ncbi:MAG: ribosome biogenesis GTPase Der [Candidatus Muproteobacteria bacterium RIFCSPHIGHO2_12_FULL_60_33]|uniref:GTPase Der n=1 Tax=Candidatus Muproteobacteria bacterium RIFCSPLOWO2_01_FULL_60_18 TaxID=1817768 RepID=A0A1F6U0V9_9PROT|nr:MAG: ribosome biogenesis GTPase Der [Candidatus Muproteobacteria bacterium RIFCSPHIGHO2_01_60_12]OGI51007.1 MAG: ribosome biogenesis GTPase Der [Candidatus Muproteobacteria bacterium RIFCSPLOWO2_01_FULL_60_18]OGI54019.1 MAG: ribosome biogenesis GTPase Der [Candidatus Muproteobacteria bacterium RIFCSPHIGHO2_02_FULL_60_13]OGI55618.1 MAG: ribosome biogenesis GTPase Der [Candidatus Muproteobacteria bacterium RIFCSPHIGHO2_12_FULL_60_33]
MKPVIVLVGRPNVGKSTLFNRLTRSRAALVADAPGLTRDRQYGDGRVGDRPYFVVDTGGVVSSLTAAKDHGDVKSGVTAQVRTALTEADAVILIVDAREGVHPADRELVADLRRQGKPVWIAVNKSEGRDPDAAVAEFYALGSGDPVAVSAAHGEGVTDLIQRVLEKLPVAEETEPDENVPRIAVIGKPNVGKSTLVNALLGEQRVVVCHEPGTTRDSIRVPLDRDGRRYTLIDTAGVRRRARIDDPLEKFSVLKTLQAIDEANVAILVIDAHAGVADQDASLAGYALEAGRALVVAVNKWDIVKESDRMWAKREIERKLSFLDFARVHFISAHTGTGVGGLFHSVDEAYASAHRIMTTPKLNRVLQAAVTATPPPLAHGRRARPKYAHQGGKNPPRVVIHGNQVASLSKSYRRYLANTFRKAFHLIGTPVLIECRQEENPYQGKKTGGGRGGRRTKRRRS